MESLCEHYQINCCSFSLGVTKHFFVFYTHVLYRYHTSIPNIRIKMKDFTERSYWILANISNGMNPVYHTTLMEGVIPKSSVKRRINTWRWSTRLTPRRFTGPFADWTFLATELLKPHCFINFTKVRLTEKKTFVNKNTMMKKHICSVTVKHRS